MGLNKESKQSTKKRLFKCDSDGCSSSWIHVDASNFWPIFRTILYRIWLHRKHNPILTLLQIAIPILIILGSNIIHQEVLPKIQRMNQWTDFSDSKRTEDELMNTIDCKKTYKTKCEANNPYIKFYPQNPFTEKIVEILSQKLNDGASDRKDYKSYFVQNIKEIEELGLITQLLNDSSYYIGGIIFDSLEPNQTLPPNTLKFTIRMANYVPSYVQPITAFSHERNSPHHYEQIMALELGITKAYKEIIDASNSSLSSSSNNNSTLSISTQAFPYLPHDQYRIDGQAEKSEWIVPTGFVLGITMIVLCFATQPVSEKETGFKLELHMMGLPSTAYWFGWILDQFIVQLISLSIQVHILFMEVGGTVLVPNGTYSLWFVVLLLYNLASLCFICFISAFFKRSVMSTYVGATIWLLTFYFMDVYIPSYVVGIGWSGKLGICLIPNGGLVWAMMHLTSLGGNWDSIGYKLDENGISLCQIMITFAFDAVFYFALIPYVDHLKPGPYEVIQPWNYFFEGLRCWCIKKKSLRSHDPTVLDDAIPQSIAVMEFVGLAKKHHRVKETFVLNGVNFKIWPGKITALLGHNGSGKTTLIRLICGEYYPTKGTVLINGYDIRYYRQKITRYMSVCFHRNLLGNHITALEHLILIGILKGLSHKEAMSRAKELLNYFELSGIKDCYVDKLLEHEKRVLSIALALIGKTPVIVLDEPTNGLTEPELKRAIWDYLKILRNSGTTIIIFTSDMEEAYYLADRIAILSKGKIVGAGTAERLERLFSTGYHLKFQLAPGQEKSNVLNFVKDCIGTTMEVENRPFRFSQTMNLIDTDESNTDFLYKISKSNETTEQGLSEASFDSPGTSPGNVRSSDVHFLNQPGAFRVDVELKGKSSSQDDDISEGVALSGVGVEIENQEMMLLLPKRESKHFQKLFSSLEEEATRKRLGILSYRFKLYSMKQAFDEVDEYMEVRDDESIEENLNQTNNRRESMHTAAVVNSQDSLILIMPTTKLQTSKVDGVLVGLQRFKGMFIKRLLWIKGGWLYALVQILVPILMLIVMIQATNHYYTSALETSLTRYNLHNMYPHSITPYRLDPLVKETGVLKAYFKELQGISSLKDLKDKSFLNYYKEIVEESLHIKMFNTYVIGGDFTELKDNKSVAYFSSVGYHAGPLSLMIMLNSWLKVDYPTGKYSVDVSSYPLRFRDEVLSNFTSKSATPLTFESSFIFAIIMGFGFFVFTSGFASQATYERLTHLKRLQLNTGVNPMTYWLSIFVIDFAASMSLAFVLLALLTYLPAHHTFQNGEFAKYFIIFWALASYSSILNSYIFSFYFRRASTSFFGMLSCNQVIGLFCFVLFSTLSSSEPKSFTLKIITFLMHFLQPYNVPLGFYALANLVVRNNVFKSISPFQRRTICGKKSNKNLEMFGQACCQDKEWIETGNCAGLHIQPYLDWTNVINKWEVFDNFVTVFIFLLVQGLIFSFALYITEHNINVKRWICSKSDRENNGKRSSTVNSERMVKYDQSDSYRDEKVKVKTQLGHWKESQDFIVHGITHRNRNRQLLTDISFVAEPGKLCCIVGPSGSGKTTLFEILANCMYSTEGNVYYKGNHLGTRNNQNFTSQIGFCSSKDFSLIRVSGKQLIKLFGRLKGIPERDLDEHVGFWLNELGLKDEAAGHCQDFSENTKQKLALACCFIGDPAVLILDDPLKYLDPESILKFWSILTNLLKNQKIVIMLYPNLDSVQRYCSKALFLVNGYIRHVSTPEALLEEYQIGKTITVIITLRTDSGTGGFELYTELKDRVEMDIPDSVIQEELHYSIRYRIIKCEILISELFGIVDAISVDFVNIVKDFEIRETTLQDVYKSFAMNQHKYKIPPSTLDTFCLTYC